MSPLQTSTLASSIVFTAAKLMTSLLEIAAHKDLVDRNLSAIITIGAVVSWAALSAAYCRDHVMQRLNLLEVRLSKVIDGYGAQCLEDGKLDAAREYARIATMPPAIGNRGRFTVVD